MQHWPDSMVTYLAEQRLLFSQDAFGMHVATGERFDDQLPGHVLEWEAGKYYANILMPFASQIDKTLKALGELDLSIDMIVPDHGPIWRKNPGRILDLYAKWNRREARNKAVIIYDTMWKSTSLMARAVADGVVAEGAHVRVMSLDGCHRSDVAAELLDAGALVVGSPTLNNAIYPTVADVLTYVKGLRFPNLLGAAFGSYGWGRGAVHEIEAILKSMKVDLVRESVRHKYVPDAAALEQCVALGRGVGQAVNERFGP
jgi:flavorubredoxin